MKWKITYYSQDVFDELVRWPSKLSAKYLRYADLIEEFGPHINNRITKALGDGLFEIRVKAQEGIGRAFFCYQMKNEIIILHSIIKKSQKTPKKDLSLAKKRMKELEK